MKKLVVLASFIFASQSLCAQALVCPADLTIEFTEKTAGDDYGVPTINTTETYNLDLNVTKTQQSCDDDFVEIIQKTWTLTYGTTTENCIQTIQVKFDSFDNYTPPADTTLVDGNINNVGPDVTGHYGPEPSGSGNIVSTYADQVFDVGAQFYKILRTWTLLDWCDASTLEHNQVIKIDGDTVLYGGEVTLGNGVALEGYLYQIVGSNGQVLEDASCDQSLSLVEKLNCIHDAYPSETLELKMSMPSGSGDYLNGVSTLDAVLIQRHILGLDPFTDAWLVIAADINNNQSVSAIDLIEQRKLILGIYDVLPANSSWKFFNADTSQDLIFGGFDFPLTELQIIAVKIGDVNYSVRP